MSFRAPADHRSTRLQSAVVGITAASALMAMTAVSRPHTAKEMRRASLIGIPSISDADPSTDAVDVPSEPDDASLRTLVLGRWKANYHGELTVENRSDGTASMRLAFDFFASLYFGSVLDLSMTWTVKEGVLSYKISSGTPTPQWEKFKARYGDEVEYQFDAVDENQMRLSIVDDPDEKLIWNRID